MISHATDGIEQRWADAVHLRTLHRRRRIAALGLLAQARILDAWYADLTAENTRYTAAPHVITSGLAATSLRSFIKEQATGSEQSLVQSLYRRLAELRQESESAYEAWFDAIGTDHHSAAQQRWAATHLTAAEVCDQLAAAEPASSENHRRTAARQRAIADDILNGQA